MKPLYKILAATMTLCILCAAPRAQARMRWGATAGANISTLKFKQDLIPVGKVAGYTAGVTGEQIFPGIGLGVDVGLMYDQQGAMLDLGSRTIWDTYGNEHIYIHTLKIPLHLRWKFTHLGGFEDKLAPIVYGGPEFDIQIGHSHCDAIKFSGGDMGLTVGAGVELYKKWQITAGYTWGMTYACKTKLLDNFSSQSRQWNMRLTYYF